MELTYTFSPVERIAAYLNNPSNWLKLAMFALLIAIAFLPDLAIAADTPWDRGANQLESIRTSTFTRTVAILAVFALGIAALMGNLNVKWAGAIIFGIILIFGAPEFVDFLKTVAEGS